MLLTRTSLRPSGCADDSGTFGKASNKTDVWALGCIILEMLTGSKAWAGKRPPEIQFLVALKQQAPPIPSGLPEPLDSTLRACLVHHQEQRASALEVVEMLQPLLGEAV
jgi:serine/threonine protein kinase